MPRPKVTPFLWFASQAEEAAAFYVSLFPDSRITNVTRYTETGPGPAGSVWIVEFELAGAPLIALNGGPHFQLNEAFSLLVDCADQAEVDHLWEKLCDGGSPSHCGWLTDRFGLTWQLVPTALPRMLADPQRAAAVMQAMLPMAKLDIARLQAAYEGL